MSAAYKERLFELVSKEDVVLFAGAGLSLYAGYPSGNALKNIFYNKLNVKEKEIIDEHQTLSTLTQNLFDLHNGRNSTISILRDVFLAKPKSTDLHTRISEIPHFKTIITTNYDQLFENTLGDKAQLLISNKDLPYLDKKRVQIYKIHGDLSLPDTIILKDSDYNNFFKNNKEAEPFWNSVKEKLTTQSILFIGYSLEDANIKVIFEKILESLGDDMKEKFFVAPNLQQFNIDKLSKKGIKYIDTTGEIFFKDLLQYLNANTFINLEKGGVSADTASNFAKNFGYDLQLKSNIAGFYLQDISSLKGVVNHKLNFTMKNDEILKKRFEDFISGKTRGDLILKNEDFLNLDIWADKFRIRKYGDITELRIMKLPIYDGNIDIILDDGFEIQNFYVKFFMNAPSNNIRQITIENNNFILNVKLTFGTDNNTKLSFESNVKEVISDVSSYLIFYQALDRISDGIGFSVLKNGRKTFYQKPIKTEKSENCSFFIEYCLRLQKIEKFYKIKFRNFKSDDINDHNFENISRVISKIENKYYEEPCREFTAHLNDDFINGGISIDSEEMVMFYRMNNCEEVEIHGHQFKLGYKDVIIMDPIFEELDVFEKIKKKELRKIKISSKINKCKIIYRDEYDSLERPE